MSLIFKVKLPNKLIANDFSTFEVNHWNCGEITATPKLQSANLFQLMEVEFAEGELRGQNGKGAFHMKELNYCLVEVDARERHIEIDNAATLRNIGQNQVYLEIDYQRLKEYKEQNGEGVKLFNTRDRLNASNDIISTLMAEVKKNAGKDIAVFYTSPEGNIKAIPSPATKQQPTKQEKKVMLQELRDILASDLPDKKSKFINKAWEYKDALNHHRGSNHLCNQLVNFFKVADNSSTASWREVLNMTKGDSSLNFALTQNSIEFSITCLSDRSSSINHGM